MTLLISALYKTLCLFAGVVVGATVVFWFKTYL